MKVTDEELIVWMRRAVEHLEIVGPGTFTHMLGLAAEGLEALADLEIARDKLRGGSLCWEIKEGSEIPQWVEKTNHPGVLKAATDLLARETVRGVEVRALDPNYTGYLMVAPGHASGLVIEGMPTDLVSPSRLERSRRLAVQRAEDMRAALEEARPYVEAYDTRKNNKDQDEVLNLIDAALGGQSNEA